MNLKINKFKMFEFFESLIDYFNEDGTYWITCRILAKKLNLTEDEVDEKFTELLDFLKEKNL
jgi:hypothetical protein